jgi:hypothetical protein
MSEMTAERVSVHDERRVAIAITGAQPMPIQHVSGRFQPTGLIIIYYKPQGGEWQVMTVKLHGPKLTVSGGHSKNTGSHFWHYISDVPEDIRYFVDKYLPTT